MESHTPPYPTRIDAPIHFGDALSKVSEYWSPQVVGRVNDQYIKVAKLKGELMWHAHADEDELFMVMYGTLRIQLEDRERSFCRQENAIRFLKTSGTTRSPMKNAASY
jgi:hypothetical protein